MLMIFGVLLAIELIIQARPPNRSAEMSGKAAVIRGIASGRKNARVKRASGEN
jgi:hypothetical protein